MTKRLAYKTLPRIHLDELLSRLEGKRGIELYDHSSSGMHTFSTPKYRRLREMMCAFPHPWEDPAQRGYTATLPNEPLQLVSILLEAAAQGCSFDLGYGLLFIQDRAFPDTEMTPGMFRLEVEE